MRRLILAAVMVWALAGSAFAQDTTLITVARKQVQGVHTFSAASPVTAEMVPIGDEYVWIAADWAPADRLDPTKSFRFNLFKSADGGATWQHVVGGGFVGNPELADTTPVGVATPASALVGMLLRVEMDVPVRTGLGFTATIMSTLPF